MTKLDLAIERVKEKALAEYLIVPVAADGEQKFVVVPSELATPAVAFAVAEHQSDLRLLVPAEPQVCL